MLQPGQIKVHFKNGNTSVYPELNKNNIVRLLSEDILRIEHYKPIFTEPKKRGRPKK